MKQILEGGLINKDSQSVRELILRLLRSAITRHGIGLGLSEIKAAFRGQHSLREIEDALESLTRERLVEVVLDEGYALAFKLPDSSTICRTNREDG